MMGLVSYFCDSHSFYLGVSMNDSCQYRMLLLVRLIRSFAYVILHLKYRLNYHFDKYLSNIIAKVCQQKGRLTLGHQLYRKLGFKSIYVNDKFLTTTGTYTAMEKSPALAMEIIMALRGFVAAK